jgi:hypothetical protein
MRPEFAGSGLDLVRIFSARYLMKLKIVTAAKKCFTLQGIHTAPNLRLI